MSLTLNIKGHDHKRQVSLLRCGEREAILTMVLLATRRGNALSSLTYFPLIQRIESSFRDAPFEGYDRDIHHKVYRGE
jgi:hypothetical protein